MIKKLLTLSFTLMFLLSFSTTTFATTNDTSLSSEQTQLSEADVQAKLKELFNGKDSLHVTFSTEPGKSSKSGIQPYAYYNQKWDLTLFSSGQLIAYNITKGKSYECDINTSYVGYGYTTNGGPVGCIQGLLSMLGAGLDGDGIFGSNTYNAILQFQRNNSNILSVDGIAGPKTFSWACYLVFNPGTNV